MSWPVIAKSYDGRVIIPPFRALVTKGEKIAVIGKNGVGKSTLVKMIAGVEAPDAGTITWGHNAAVGYMPQDHHGIIKKGGVSLVGFGNFTVTKRAARDGINPATGAKIKIKASKGVKFKAGAALKKSVNK